jgi:hypothetical protein
MILTLSSWRAIFLASAEGKAFATPLSMGEARTNTISFCVKILTFLLMGGHAIKKFLRLKQVTRYSIPRSWVYVLPWTSGNDDLISGRMISLAINITME